MFLIGEIGLNQNSDMQVCKRLIDASFATGWDCVKFQKRTPELCVPEHQKNVMRDTPWGGMTYLEYRHKIELHKGQYDYIDWYCKQKPILWSASVWDMPSLTFLLEYDVPFIKIPSAKLTHYELVRKAAMSGKKVLLSTGMSTLDEIDNAVMVLREWGDEFALMHTNSAYPAPVEDLNLSMIKTLQDRYGCEVGYSGHEQDLGPTVIAATLGATIIERHITLDHNMWGSDHKASLEVHAMDMLQKRIKEGLLCLGDGVKKVTKKEEEMRDRLRDKHWVRGQNDSTYPPSYREARA